MAVIIDWHSDQLTRPPPNATMTPAQCSGRNQQKQEANTWSTSCCCLGCSLSVRGYLVGGPGVCIGVCSVSVRKI